MCMDRSTQKYFHKCVQSNKTYEQTNRVDSKTGIVTSLVSSRCDSDPHVYQGCGFSTETTSDSFFLCGGNFGGPEQGLYPFVECGKGCDDSKNYSGKKIRRREMEKLTIFIFCQISAIVINSTIYLLPVLFCIKSE